MDWMGQISKNGQKSRSVRRIGWVRLDKRIRGVKVSNGFDGSNYIKGSEESKVSDGSAGCY